ncbi:MAG: LCP family protein [Microgenomates group bacterium]
MKKLIIFICLFLIILGLGGSFYFWYFWKKIPLKPTNILILGIGGENHPGKDLTDTIIFISLNPSAKNILLLSIPRDIWIPQWRIKINSVYHYKGLQETKNTIEEIIGQKPDYGIIVDFNIFKKIIDFLGGIEVDVERSFDDYKYPIAGKENDLCNGDPEFKCRYEHVHFEAGKQLMDGETALKFVRSRNASGEEGTDFARAQRQQKVILAIKNKILSFEFLSSPRKVIQLIKLINLNIKTDIPPQDYWQLLKLGITIKNKNIKTAILNDQFLINPKNKEKYDNQWVLIPKKEDWQDVKKYVNELLNN